MGKAKIGAKEFGRQLISRFIKDERGAFAVIFGLTATVLIALGGASVDYTLWQNAQTAARNSADTGALAAAVSRSQDLPTIRTIVAGASTQDSMFTTLGVTNVTYDKAKDQVGVTVEGTYQTLFVTLVGVHTLPVKAFATSERAQLGELEVALVLDNTFSMSASDGSGSTKIAALKTAARSLVDILWQDDTTGTVKIALVPYADYVNVGVANRGEPWLSIPDDYSKTSTSTCTTKTSETYGCQYEPSYSCPYYEDGVEMARTCRGAEIPGTCQTRPVDPPKTTCSTPTTTNYKWWGCVYSRKAGTLRLNDSEPNTPYLGPVTSSQSCLNPIVTLTKDRDAVRASIASMIVNIGGYRPETYIPGGMVWGVNVLSPTKPFDQGKAYDPGRLRPRKAIVLMTDGDNTLRFNSSNGQHPGLSSGTTGTTQKTQTDNDTKALCTYAKSQGIEVFTVGFGTLMPSSDALLSSCATDARHYFSATNAAELQAAFGQIGRALRFVRLVE